MNKYTALLSFVISFASHSSADADLLTEEFADFGADRPFVLITSEQFITKVGDTRQLFPTLEQIQKKAPTLVLFDDETACSREQISLVKSVLYHKVDEGTPAFLLVAKSGESETSIESQFTGALRGFATEPDTVLRSIAQGNKFPISLFVYNGANATDSLLEYTSLAESQIDWLDWRKAYREVIRRRFEKAGVAFSRESSFAAEIDEIASTYIAAHRSCSEEYLSALNELISSNEQAIETNSERIGDLDNRITVFEKLLQGSSGN